MEESKEWLSELLSINRYACRCGWGSQLPTVWFFERQTFKAQIWTNYLFGSCIIEGILVYVSEEKYILDTNVNFEFNKIFSLLCSQANYLISLSQGFFRWKRQRSPLPRLRLLWGLNESIYNKYICVCVFVCVYICGTHMYTKQISLFKIQMLPQTCFI